MKMDAIDAYKIYTAIKNHFVLDSYDYFKYNKKINVSYDSFLKRKDKIFFAKLGNKKDKYLEDFLVANFLHDTKTWVGELLSDDCEERYKTWKKRQESLTYVFKNEIDFLSDMNADEFNKFFDTVGGDHPPIIKKYLRSEISLDTLVILNSILKFMNRYDKCIVDPIYKEVSKLCRKYQPFLKYEPNRMKKTLAELVIQN
jgi:hypothetical protein